VFDDLLRCYEVLGVAPEATAEELKAAYRDLAKVWHPDRFAHDPRLQQKAQEKLKEINEAYEQLTSGRAPRRTRPAPPPAPAAAPRPTTHEPFNAYATRTAAAYADAPTSPVARRTQSQTLVLSALVSAIVFGTGVGALLIKRAPDVPPAMQSAAPALAAEPHASDQTAADDDARTTAATSRQSKKRATPPTPVVPTPPAASSLRAPAAAPVRALPTVTLTIDPTTNLIATAACPNKMRVTYASGAEPHQLCNAHHRAAAPRAKDARLNAPAQN
jgi:hypothetical protein